MLFYLGTHKAHWLGFSTVPLFISRRVLEIRRHLPRARAPWALDSGGFSELSMFGEWRTSPAEYAAQVRRYADEIGGLAWAAPQDWMCEPWLIKQTGLSITEHQRRTIDNFIDLRRADLPVVPVLQGWELDDYLRHYAAYENAGITLDAEPLVGLGSVCRRQNTREASLIIHVLTEMGLRLHGFGFKLTGLAASGHRLASADSMAWSYQARRNPAPGHTHQSCSNCWEYAFAWREKALRALDVPKQEILL